MSDYRLSHAAKDDLRRIYMYGYEQWGEVAADHYYHALFDRFEEIAAHPYLYPAVDYIRHGYRRSVCGAESIYYRIENDIIEIMAIIKSQDTETFFP